MAEAISREEFNDRMDTLHDTVTNGFDGVHKRQDVTNGRLLVAEKDIVRIQTQLTLPKSEHSEADTRKITMWEVRIFSAGFLGCCAVVVFLKYVLPYLKP